MNAFAKFLLSAFSFIAAFAYELEGVTQWNSPGVYIHAFVMASILTGVLHVNLPGQNPTTTGTLEVKQ